MESPEQLDARTDLQLVAEINSGDAEAFEALYFRHRDWVLNLALRFTRDEDLALDVLQETFIYLLKKFPGFRLTANLKTFLYPAVKNLSLSARQKAERLQSDDAGRTALDALVAPENSPQLEELLSVLAALGEEHREVVWLRFVDGLNLAEIAKALEIPLGTVKSRLHYALNFLRNDARTKEFFNP